MPELTAGVKSATPPPAAGVSPTPRTAQTAAPANPASTGGGKTPESVPYARFKEVVDEREQLNERMEMLERQVHLSQQQPKPTPASVSSPNVLPDPDADPLGNMLGRMARIEQSLIAQESRAKMSEGEKLLSQIKQDYPVFSDPTIGPDALTVLQSRLTSEEANIRPPGRIIREVAEKYSKFVVAENNGVLPAKAATAAATAAMTGGTPEVGAVRQPAFQPKTFDEAHKAAKGAWDRLAERMTERLQV